MDRGGWSTVPGTPGGALNSNGNGELRERAAITSLILASYAMGYFGVGWATDPRRAHSLATPLDALIPFVPGTIFLYAWLFTAMLFPLFVVRSPALFRRVGLAYAAVIAACLVVFAVYPVSAADLRTGVGDLDVSRFTGWGVNLVYTLDPPYNLFPSLHLAIATLAALSAWKARPIYGAIGFAWVLPIAVSVSTLKQHYVVDSVAGAALACAVYAAIIRPYARVSERESAYGWGGPLLYLGFNVLFYAVAYVVFRSGVDAPG
jgi:membrane-associated phospholipid phosphatase